MRPTPRPLTQRVEGRQDVEVHAVVQQRPGCQRETEHTGVVPLGDLKGHLELLRLLAGLELGMDLCDDLSPKGALVREPLEAADEHHQVGIRAASQRCAFG